MTFHFINIVVLSYLVLCIIMCLFDGTFSLLSNVVHRVLFVFYLYMYFKVLAPSYDVMGGVVINACSNFINIERFWVFFV